MDTEKSNDRLVIVALAKMANFTQQAVLFVLEYAVCWVPCNSRPCICKITANSVHPSTSIHISFARSKWNRGTLLGEDLLVAMEIPRRSKQGRETFDEALIRPVLGISSDCSSSLWCFLLDFSNWFRSRFCVYYAVCRMIHYGQSYG